MKQNEIISNSKTVQMHHVGRALTPPELERKVNTLKKQLTPAEFERKVNTLKKQCYELATLCNVPGCLIIRSPDCSQTYTWPESRDEVKKFAELYFSKTTNGSGSRSLDERLKNDGERMFLRALDAKIDRLRKRIECARLATDQNKCVGDNESCTKEKMIDSARVEIEKELVGEAGNVIEIEKELVGESESSTTIDRLETEKELMGEKESSTKGIEIEKELVGENDFRIDSAGLEIEKELVGENDFAKLVGENDLTLKLLPDDAPSEEEEEENRDLVSEWERFSEAFKEVITGKRKFGSCSMDEEKFRKTKKQVKQLMRDFNLTTDIAHEDFDQGTWLRLGM